MIDQTDGSVPRIRFKGFGGAWEPKKLGRVYKERNERGNDSLPILSVSIHSGISSGELSSDALGKKVRRSENKSLYKRVQSGDLVLNMMRAWQGAVGVAKIEGMVSPAYITATPDDTVHPPFMDCGLRRPEVVVQMNKLSYGVTDFRKRLYWDSFIRIDFDIPSVLEQEKIATYFDHLDIAISLHQRKHEKLIALKKAASQRMFPSLKKSVPDLRFKGFSGEWGEISIEDAMQNIANNSLSRADLNYSSGAAKNVHYGDVLIKFGEVLDAQNDELPLIANDAILEKVIPSRLRDGDIVMADAAEDEAVGKCTELSNIGSQVVVAGLHTIALRPKKPFAPYFLGYYLNSRAFHNQLLPIMQGTKVLSISKTAISRLLIWFPTDEAEQRAIGAYFYNLDKLIRGHATQIQKLIQVKAACLDKMFV
jgi:type I restriction enzyme, S subunit